MHPSASDESSLSIGWVKYLVLTIVLLLFFQDDDSPVAADPAQVDLAEKTPSEKDLSNEAPPEAATATQPVAMESPTAAAGESVIE